MPPPVARAAAVPPLSQVIPPLILGTATFNHQYHPNPNLNLSLPILARALDLGVTAIDTSPYYGPSERLLGAALRSLRPDRSSLFLITKAGRVGPSAFDYSPAHIAHSVRRSLARLGTSHLDLVHCHDVEFLPPSAVLAAVRELRRLRDDHGILRYVGISGYPLPVLAALAEYILAETGEPLDCVQSYSNFCLQNDALAAPDILARFRAAGVSVVTNASMLSMGLLTTRGADAGPQASWHPAPRPLRRKCTDLAPIAQAAGEKLEDVALRWAMGEWARKGADFGTSASMNVAASAAAAAKNTQPAATRVGVSVLGVTNAQELDDTWLAWRDAMHELAIEKRSPGTQQPALTPEDEAVVARGDKIRRLVEHDMWPSLGEWRNHIWASPQEGFVNTRREFGVLPEDFDETPVVIPAEEEGPVPEAVAHSIEAPAGINPPLGVAGALA